MGTDIHYVVERNHEGTWVGVMSTEEPVVSVRYDDRDKFPLWRFKTRDYGFFAKIAGVRGDGPEPLGVPADASDLALMDVSPECGDLHSHSHMPLVDFLTAHFQRHSGDPVTTLATAALEDKSVEDLLCTEYKLDPDVALSEYRVVFAFDN